MKLKKLQKMLDSLPKEIYYAGIGRFKINVEYRNKYWTISYGAERHSVLRYWSKDLDKCVKHFKELFENDLDLQPSGVIQ